MTSGSIFARKQTSGNRPETFAIIVTGYDTSSTNNLDHRVFGTRMDTGADVEVTLRDIDYDNSRGLRADVATLASPRVDRQHPGTTIGGTLLIQEAFNNDGVFAARWIKPLSHEPGEAFTFMAQAYLSPVLRKGDGQNAKSSAFVSFIHDGDALNVLPEDVSRELFYTPPFQAQNADDTLQVLEQLLQDGLGVGLRAVAADGRVDAIPVFPAKDKTPQQIVAAFRRDVFDQLSEHVDSGALKIEVIPFSTVWAGPKTVQALSTNKSMKSRIDRFNQPDGRRMTRLYRPALVTVRFSRPSAENGAQVLLMTNIEPLNTRNPAYGIEEALHYTKTEFLDPGEAPARSGQQQSQGNDQQDTDPQDGGPAGRNGAGAHPMDDDYDQGFAAGPDDRPEPPAEAYDEGAPRYSQRGRDAAPQQSGQRNAQPAPQQASRGFSRPSAQPAQQQAVQQQRPAPQQRPAAPQQQQRPAAQQPAPNQPASRFARPGGGQQPPQAAQSQPNPTSTFRRAR